MIFSNKIIADPIFYLHCWAISEAQNCIVQYDPRLLWFYIFKCLKSQIQNWSLVAQSQRFFLYIRTKGFSTFNQSYHHQLSTVGYFSLWRLSEVGLIMKLFLFKVAHGLRHKYNQADRKMDWFNRLPSHHSVFVIF